MADLRPAYRRCLLLVALLAVGAAVAFLLTAPPRTADAHDRYTGWSAWIELAPGDECNPTDTRECESWSAYRTRWQNTADQWTTENAVGIPGGWWVGCRIPTPSNTRSSQIPRCWPASGGTGPNASVSFVNEGNEWKYDFFKTRTRSHIDHQHETTTTTTAPPGTPTTMPPSTTTTTTIARPASSSTTCPLGQAPAFRRRLPDNTAEFGPCVTPPRPPPNPCPATDWNLADPYTSANIEFVGDERLAAASETLQRLGGGGIVDGHPVRQLRFRWETEHSRRLRCVWVDHYRVNSLAALVTPSDIAGRASVTLNWTWERGTLMRTSEELTPRSSINPSLSQCGWYSIPGCYGYRRIPGILSSPYKTNSTTEWAADTRGGRVFRLDVYANNNWDNGGRSISELRTFYSQVTCPANSTEGALTFSGLYYPGTNSAPWITDDGVTTAPNQTWLAQYRHNCGTDFTPHVTIEVPDGYRDGQTNADEIEVTFTKQPTTECVVATGEQPAAATYTQARFQPAATTHAVVPTPPQVA